MSGGPQRRSTRSPGELLLRPYGPPGRRSCGQPVQLPHSWRTWCSLDDPAHSGQPCMRTKIPSRDRRNCTRRADEQAEIHRTGPRPPETPRLRGSWPGPDCDGSSVPGPLASPVDWAVSPGLTGQPKHASYPAGAPGKQADAPGRGSDRGRPSPPLAGSTKRSAYGPSPLRRGARVGRRSSASSSRCSTTSLLPIRSSRAWPAACQSAGTSGRRPGRGPPGTACGSPV